MTRVEMEDGGARPSRQSAFNRLKPIDSLLGSPLEKLSQAVRVGAGRGLSGQLSGSASRQATIPWEVADGAGNRSITSGS